MLPGAWPSTSSLDLSELHDEQARPVRPVTPPARPPVVTQPITPTAVVGTRRVGKNVWGRQFLAYTAADHRPGCFQRFQPRRTPAGSLPAINVQLYNRHLLLWRFWRLA